MRIPLAAALAGLVLVSSVAEAQPTPPEKPAAAKPAQKGQARRSKKKDKEEPARTNGPNATLAGFKMLEDGGSRVFVEVSRKVDVSEHPAEGRLVYRLKGATVPTRTNRLALYTTFFPTSVSKVQLQPDGDDVDLVIDLRQTAKPTHKVLETEGGMVLEIDFPRIAPMVQAPTSAAPPPAATRPTETKTVKGASDTAY